MSKLSQINSRPPTMAISTRVDLRHLATLANFWQTQGESPRSISELSRLSLESLCEMLVSNHLIKMVESHDEAQSILTKMGYSLHGIQKRNLLKSLSQEGRLNPELLSTPTSPPLPTPRSARSTSDLCRDSLQKVEVEVETKELLSPESFLEMQRQISEKMKSLAFPPAQTQPEGEL